MLSLATFSKHLTLSQLAKSSCSIPPDYHTEALAEHPGVAASGNICGADLLHARPFLFEELPLAEGSGGLDSRTSKFRQKGAEFAFSFRLGVGVGSLLAVDICVLRPCCFRFHIRVPMECWGGRS